MRGINQKGVQSLHLIAPRVVESKDGPAVSCARVLWGWLLDKWGAVWEDRTRGSQALRQL